MPLTPTIIAPDTSHWSNWIDAALNGPPAVRQTARDLHERLLQQGRVPLLSWHHLEELLVVDDPANASARVSFIQSLPMTAWMQTPGEQGLGGIIDILAAEAVAYDAGCRTLAAVRDHVRPPPVADRVGTSGHRAGRMGLGRRPPDDEGAAPARRDAIGAFGYEDDG